MTTKTDQEDSEFYKEFPLVKHTYWYVINGARAAINEAKEKEPLVPRYIDWCSSELEALKEEKTSGFYKNFENCSELKEIEAALQEAKDKLIAVAKDLQIDWENYFSYVIDDKSHQPDEVIATGVADVSGSESFP